MSNIQSDHSQLSIDDEIDLKALFMTLWWGRWLIGMITGISASASVVIALMLPNIYTANALLAPAEQSGGGMSYKAAHTDLFTLARHNLSAL